MRFRSFFATAVAVVLLTTFVGAVSLEQVQPLMPRIDLFVHAEGSPLETLTLEDITATMDDVPLKAELLQTSDRGIFYVFLVDISRSISEQHLVAARQAVLDIYRKMGPDDLLSLISFGSSVNILLQGGEPADQVEAALDTIHSTDNNTRFYDAMNTLVQTVSAKSDMRRIAVVVSDGVDATDGGMTQEQLEQILRESGVAVYALAVDSTTEAVRERFRNFIQVSGGELFPFSPSDAGEKLGQLQSYIDQTWHLRLTAPTNIADGEEHQLAVQFGQLDNLTVQIRPTKWIPDEKPPYALSVDTALDSATVTVTFNEPVSNASDSRCYVLKDPEGQVVPFTLLSYDSTHATLLCPQLINPTDWTLELRGLIDVSMEANKIIPISLKLAEPVVEFLPTEISEMGAVFLFLPILATLVVAVVLAIRSRKKRKPNPIILEDIAFIYESGDSSDHSTPM